MHQPLHRRALLLTAALAACARVRAAEGDAAVLLREGRLVVLLRHASAPGTFDPPEFRLGDCATQRNLDDAGRAQARRIGQWFASRRLQPSRVRSSPWCRCVDTARLAFGGAEVWPALSSPRGTPAADTDRHRAELRRELEAASARAGFEVWVTHQFVIQALAGTPTASGEALLLRGPRLLARLAAA